MKPISQRALHRQAGFSLIEILVGLVIGLLATLVITQVFSVYEGQKRTTTGAADAQTNGSIALYMLTTELKMAGYDLLPSRDNSPLACTTLNSSPAGMTSISPVTISDGGIHPGASDTITIRYGSSPSGGVPSRIKGVGTSGLNDVTLDNNFGCKAGDVAMVVNGSTCAFSPVVASAVPDLVTVTLTDVSVLPANPTNFSLACLGPWVTTSFSVNPNYDPTVAANSQAYLQRTQTFYPVPGGGNLPPAPTVADIVDIQAQYGISATTASNTVTQWVDATGVTWAAPTVANRNRIKAIHVVVVARSGSYDNKVVTNTCTTKKGTLNKGPCAWDDTNVDAAPEIDLSNDPDWQHYRYRTYDTIVPLRNMIWAKDTL